ncbi:MAG: GNAT family N-acetyltransferase [Gammaproteobacteria bacterium]|nr:GNAT family N-acetyltransferase [Gammaproteobacteria bacterium]MBL7003965.1 GNAT family N-acetyltransferase [Gammaproteobacteria bacterium]
MDSFTKSTLRNEVSRSTQNIYKIEISQSYKLEELKENWLEIETVAQPSFFLSWDWMSNWIETYAPELVVITAHYQNKLVAIGLFTYSTEKRHKIISSKQLRLNQTGNNDLDQIWIEYNDFICIPEHQHHAINASIQMLQKKTYQWDELIFSMSPSLRYESLLSENFQIKVIDKTPCYAVDLSKIRASKHPYIETISANSRYQIRRSIRKYKQLYGKIDLTIASNLEEAMSYFHEAGNEHKNRWSDSGFKNPRFIEFHENLINRNLAKGSVELIKVTSGKKVIAIMYNLIQNKNVYFYLQGLSYESDNKLKPGLVAHSLITQYYLDKGMNLYDYMGGYSQYKAQLASHSTDCYTICIQRPKISFILEDLGRKIKRLSGL